MHEIISRIARKASIFFEFFVECGDKFIDNEHSKSAYIKNFVMGHNHRSEDKLLVIKIDLDQGFFALDRA